MIVWCNFGVWNQKTLERRLQKLTLNLRLLSIFKQWWIRNIKLGSEMGGAWGMSLRRELCPPQIIWIFNFEVAWLWGTNFNGGF